VGSVDQSLLRLNVGAPRRGYSGNPVLGELHRMLVDLASDFACRGTTVYELGCTDSALPQLLHERLPDDISFVGTDDSEDRLSSCRKSLVPACLGRRIGFMRADLNQGIALRDASVVLMVSTLRTLQPFKRAPLMADIHRGLRDGGCLLVVEQMLGRDSLLNNLFASHGAHRRLDGDLASASGQCEGRDDRLVPYSFAEEQALLTGAGFRSVEVFFKWYGVCGLIAVK
jgi:tRNA (cmo5U34)-methyltransferase